LQLYRIPAVQVSSNLLLSSRVDDTLREKKKPNSATLSDGDADPGSVSRFGFFPFLLLLPRCRNLRATCSSLATFVSPALYTPIICYLPMVQLIRSKTKISLRH
jgi:hypothetical protein